MRDLIKDNTVLATVVKNLWKVYKYHQEYQLFLLGGYSEEAFRAIADQFAAACDDIPAKQLVYASSCMLSLLGEPLTSSELSVLLNVDPHMIEKALGAAQHVE